ncbi:MAG: DUF3568 family protein [Planctomycetes bacterium]|nr:DUF3568 family protein [Planctomycetota bacterium]
MRKERVFLVVLLAGLVAGLGGCFWAVAAGAGAGTYAFVKGDLETMEKESVAELYVAAVAALEELQIPVITKSQDALVAQIEGRNAEDKKVTIRIEVAENELSKMSIRIGTFGDQDQSQVIYDKIKALL